MSPEEFHKVVDRSAGGPAYRELITKQNKLITSILIIGTAISFLLIVVLIRFSSILDEVKASNDNGEEQRVLIAAQTRILLECSTPSPAPGTPLPAGEDGKHECYESGDSRGIGLVVLLRKSEVALSECVRDKRPDLQACLDAKVPVK